MYSASPRDCLNSTVQVLTTSACASASTSSSLLISPPMPLQIPLKIVPKDARYTLEDVRAPGKVLDLCEAVGVPTVVLPRFMENSMRIYGRQILDESSSIGSGPSTPATAETVTSLQTEFGAAASTSTGTFIADPSSSYTIVFVWQAGPSVATVVSTTTVAPWVSPFTSTITATDSPVATRIIGVPYTTSTSSATVSSSPTNTPAPTPPPSGLSLGAKIGIGVAIPLAVIALALGIFIYLRRKRKATRKHVVETQETDDGGLPEHISDIPKVDVSKFPENPNGFRQVHELGHDDQSGVVRRDVHELNNETAPTRHEMIARESPGDVALTRSAHEDGSLASTGVSISHPGHQETPPGVQFAQRNQSPNLVTNPKVHDVEDDEEVREMQQEMAHIQARREQLQRLQALEAREAELKRTIEEKKAAAESQTSHQT
ncbi:hypothetical protein ONS95_005081 [Cadophora gregata]|uniref:uncharacterized protein n=1 Tax=Cadophora gregata TaxID=51156 RepID=UPI0026DD7AEA|nr:uncharacterized protein ONS95_005081 [Cadophora gregata]KAK0104813.1 hypothetical protein ONS95_005081 [Cadophora gregata]KAK0115104.1 hypothetical protein ONS96_013574 [Cadophora gregata f. sp. sojae]